MDAETGQSTTLTGTGESQNQTGTGAEGGEPQFDIAKFVGPDGKLLEGWKDGLLPEDMRKDGFWDIFDNVRGVFKTAGSQAKTIGKKGVIPITETSTQSEIDEYRRAMNIPAESSGYQYTPPEDITTEDLSPEFIQSTLEKFHEANYTPKHVQVALDVYADHLRDVDKAIDESYAELVKEAEDRITKKHGAQKEQMLHLAKKAITTLTQEWSDEDRLILFGTDEEPSGINDPDFAHLKPLFLDLFAEVGKKLSEHKVITETEGVTTDIKKQIADLEAILGFMDGTLKKSLDSKDRERYTELVKQRDELYKRLYPK